MSRPSIIRDVAHEVVYEVVYEADALKALAHPLRIQLHHLLQIRGKSTASQLAETVDRSPALVTYHLRRLATAGLVTRHGKNLQTGRRGVWWQPTTPTPPLPPTARPALVAVPNPASAPVSRQGLHHVLALNSRELELLHGELGAVLGRWADQTDDKGRGRFSVAISVVPTSGELAQDTSSNEAQ